MDRRIFLWAMALLVVLPPSAEARKWTDVAGNQIAADYVRVHEGEVVLRQGTRIIRCPYDKFSELDKAFIRKQMEAERTNAARRTGINQLGGPLAPEISEDSEVRELRTWHDIQGKKILGQYAGFSGGLVELIKDGKRISYPISAFSLADQYYVAQILVSEGRADEIPTIQDSNDADGAGASEKSNAYDPDAPSGNAPMEGGFGSSEPDYLTTDPSSHSPSDPTSSNFPEPSLTGPESQASNSPTSQTPPGHSDGANPERKPSNSRVRVGICSNCNKQVPAHVSAGDRCPHCGVQFEYEERADGSREYASQWSERHTRGIVRLSILALFVIVGALGALFRR